MNIAALTGWVLLQPVRPHISILAEVVSEQNPLFAVCGLWLWLSLHNDVFVSKRCRPVYNFLSHGRVSPTIFSWGFKFSAGQKQQSCVEKSATVSIPWSLWEWSSSCVRGFRFRALQRLFGGLQTSMGKSGWLPSWWVSWDEHLMIHQDEQQKVDSFDGLLHDRGLLVMGKLGLRWDGYWTQRTFLDYLIFGQMPSQILR